MVVRMIVLAELRLHQLQNYKMKKKHVLFLLLLTTTMMVLSSCKKTAQQQPLIIEPPVIQPVTFAVIGKDGKPLVQAKTDVITLTYVNKGTGKQENVNSLIYQVPEGVINESLENYNGLLISGDLRAHVISGQNPGGEFEFAVNGKKIGTIFYECDLSQNANFKTKAFKFDGETVVANESGGFLPVYVIKLK